MTALFERSLAEASVMQGEANESDSDGAGAADAFDALLDKVARTSHRRAVTQAQLRRAWLLDAHLEGADLRGANLEDAILLGADLRAADLSDSNLQGARLYDAILRGACLLGANLRGASLGDARLDGANLYGADLTGADLAGATFSAHTILPDGARWTAGTDLRRFTDPKHPRFRGPEWALRPEAAM